MQSTFSERVTDGEEGLSSASASGSHYGSGNNSLLLTPTASISGTPSASMFSPQ